MRSDFVRTRLVRLAVLAFTGTLVAAAASVAHPDTNPTPISVPLIGTQGKASLYPSTINVIGRGGQSQTGQIRVLLHGVTHPCPEELAVVLVHDDADAYLLMSSAGGCRPLQGTTLIFSTFNLPIPNNQPASPPYSAFEYVDVSFYAPIPNFPAPFPLNFFHTAMPPATTNINGTWSLYVYDRTPGNRGAC